VGGGRDGGVGVVRDGGMKVGSGGEGDNHGCHLPLLHGQH